MISWGDGGGLAPASAETGVVALFSNNLAFAALKDDGSVVAWGDASVASLPKASDVTTIVVSDEAFAAMKADGSVVTFGAIDAMPEDIEDDLGSGVVDVFVGRSSFAAIKEDGRVIVHGLCLGAGSAADALPEVAEALSGGVIEFGANNRPSEWMNGLVRSRGGRPRSSGQTTARGESCLGRRRPDWRLLRHHRHGRGALCWRVVGLAASVLPRLLRTGLGGCDRAARERHLAGHPEPVRYRNSAAFAAITSEGGLVSFGDASRGGVEASIRCDPSFEWRGLDDEDSLGIWLCEFDYYTGDSPLEEVLATERAFAGLRADGSVETWGHYEKGGVPEALQVLLNPIDPYWSHHDRYRVEAARPRRTP